MSEKARCNCHDCSENRNEFLMAQGLQPEVIVMIFCPICGNKRCPKASYHELECTNSDEPGQPGSIYE